jgi:restriction system protein
MPEKNNLAVQQEKIKREREREATRLQKEREHQLKQAQKETQAQDKARKQHYEELRQKNADDQTTAIAQVIESMTNLLSSSLKVDPAINVLELKKTLLVKEFTIPQHLSAPLERPTLSAPEMPSMMKRLIPGVMKEYERALHWSQDEYHRKLEDYESKEGFRNREISRLRSAHEAASEASKHETEEFNRRITRLWSEYEDSHPNAIREYCSLVLAASAYPKGFTKTVEMIYIPESKQLVVEYDLPSLDIVPTVESVRYVKSKDEFVEKQRSAPQVRSLYASIINQITLRSLNEIFRSDRKQYIDTIVFSGYVDTIDRATGREIRPCIITVRTTRDIFETFDLSRVEPEACLKKLSASVSPSPSELAPVRPVLVLNMVDPRFVQEEDILSTLDTRPNLMELSPNEFESLITNLFQTMGLDTRQTQASRDGGVDCVAFDPRPIFGGKVVIQAKRYKNTVGVSAVRDLYGTLQNEGASKGILVTTSGYGKAAFEFAQGKPMELLDGSHLLYLLKEHSNLDAKIEIPKDWRDPEMDS